MARAPYLPRRVRETEPNSSVFSTSRARAGFAPWHLGPAANGAPPPAGPGHDPAAEERAALVEAARTEGLAAARADAKAETEALTTALRQSLVEAASVRQTLEQGYRTEVVELALAAATALVQSDLVDARTRLSGILAQALESLGTQVPLRISVGPSELAETQAFVETHPDIEATVRSDPGLGPGDLRIDSATGSVEALIAERVDRIRALVAGRIGGDDE